MPRELSSRNLRAANVNEVRPIRSAIGEKPYRPARDHRKPNLRGRLEQLMQVNLLIFTITALFQPIVSKHDCFIERYLDSR